MAASEGDYEGDGEAGAVLWSSPQAWTMLGARPRELTRPCGLASGLSGGLLPLGTSGLLAVFRCSPGSGGLALWEGQDLGRGVEWRPPGVSARAR